MQEYTKEEVCSKGKEYMRFSIIVPIYNTEKYLDKCIKSILNQTMSDYELILIDDCSTDDSLTIAYKYESNHVKVLKNASNSGLSETRNVGIKMHLVVTLFL